jgi:hypothetical protein
MRALLHHHRSNELDDPALVVALMLAVRGGRMTLDADADRADDRRQGQPR